MTALGRHLRRVRPGPRDEGAPLPARDSVRRATATRVGLRGRLLALVLAALVPAMILIVALGLDSQRRLAAEATARVVSLIRVAAEQAAAVRDEAHQLLAAVAATEALLDHDPVECAKLLRGLQFEPRYANLGAADLEGEVWCSALPLAGPVNIADRAYFRRALSSGDFAVGDFQVGRITGQPSVNVGYPLRDAAGKPIGIVFAALEADTLATVVHPAELPDGSVITMVDGTGMIVARQPAQPSLIGRSYEDSVVGKAVADEPNGVVDGIGIDGVRRLFAFQRVEGFSGSYLSIGVPAAGVLAAGEAALAHALIALALVSALAILAAWLMGGRLIVHRLRTLALATGHVAGGDYRHRTGLARGRDEIADLASAFEAMSGALQERNAERDRLLAAIEQASDAVIITDRGGTIEYVNSAFERMTGYARDEAIGQNPRILKSGKQSATFYRALWRRLTRGEPWSGRFSNRRADGGLYDVEATITPIHGSDGEVGGYIGVQRDVTDLLAARSSLAAAFRERAAVTAALARLQPRESAEATASAICDELAGLPGVHHAAIITFLDPTHATALAAVGPAGLPLLPGRPLPTSRAIYLHGRSELGPWAEAWRPRPEDGRYGQAMAEIGTRAIAYAPIRNDEGLLGVIAVGTTDEVFAAHVIEHLPIVGEFAATASALLASQLERGRRDTQTHGHITRILTEHAFRPVFQPIVDLGSGMPVGYEALTRFDERMPPDRVFAEAHRVGLGIDLEIASLAAALEAAEALPADAWLSLNASPDVILDGSHLAALLRDRSRRIALEITEHVVIDDYKAIRRAVAKFGPNVSLAVDDAGAGFASLRHVVELGPRYLKLDVGLIRGVDRDPTRQAMVAGLAHFATRAGCEVIAEGIEKSGELKMLRELGVGLGQGYLLGRPRPLPMIAEGASGTGERLLLRGRSARVRSTVVRAPAGPLRQDDPDGRLRQGCGDAAMPRS